MKFVRGVSLILLCGCVLLTGGCSSGSSSDPTTPATFSIVGTWAYTMLAGNNTWDSGTFTFSGSPESGTYTQVNIYNITYTGNYAVNGANVTLDGSEDFSGTMTDAANMNGTWNSDDSSESGTWTAIKQ